MAAYHFGIEVGDEQASGLVHSVRAPVFRVCQEEYLLPVLQVWYDLECFWDLSSSEAAHDLAYCLVHFHYLGIKTLGQQYLSALPAE